MQTEIIDSKRLLNDKGDLAQAGFAKKLLPQYHRSDVKASKLRLKEWDYYLITNSRFGLALTVADNGYMGLDSVSFLDFENKWEKTVSPMQILPMGKKHLPETSFEDSRIESCGKHYEFRFETKDGMRTLTCRMDDFLDKKPLTASIKLTDAPEESMVICTPFEKKKHFYYNQKINCMKASGTVTIGDDTYTFSPADSTAVLDWGRGVWTYHNTWYWGSLSGYHNNIPFGWNIGYGFGDTSAASENMLFYNGKAHKLEDVRFCIPEKDGKFDYLSPWKLTSSDGRFEMDFTPILDRSSCMNVGILKSDQHQVFGRFSGKAVLDDGEVLEIQDLLGFAEHVENKW